MKEALFIGVDIGSQGIRSVLMDAGGDLKSKVETPLPLSKESRTEQSPDLWWKLCIKSLKKLISGETVDRIQAIAVTSTSGTVIPLDKNYRPLHNAIMYSDGRSTMQAQRCKKLAERYIPDGYTGFNTSSGLSSMVWFVETFPEKAKELVEWAHAADYITGKLSGVRGVTDYTNALKSGFDPENKIWPSWLFEHLPLRKEWLPEVVAPGEVIGTIEAEVAKDLGLLDTVKVTAGVTDGCASQIASGAIRPGDWNTTIGTTLVVKGVTRKRVLDPKGRLYSHRHPMGFWMPGGASNTGADWISQEYGENLDRLSQAALEIFPTGHISYPLRQDGERFPFISPEARGFEPGGLSIEERFTANLEGVAYLERYAYELIQNLSEEKVSGIFTAGGGSESDVWLSIRSSVLNLPVYKMKNVSGAVGAAILAASNTWFSSVIEAVKEMTRIEKEVIPDQAINRIYESNYQKFIEIMKNKGYIKGGWGA